MSTSRSSKSSYHHGELRTALVEAGLAILAEGGDPAALGLREAARRAGVSAMAPYRHFPDKHALLAAVATVGLERLRAALEAADARAQGREALIAQGAAYVAFAVANPGLFRMTFAGRSAGPPDRTLQAAWDAAHAVLVRRVAVLVPAALVENEALRCWALVHGIAGLAVDGLVGEDARIDPAAAGALAERLLRLDPIPG